MTFISTKFSNFTSFLQVLPLVVAVLHATAGTIVQLSGRLGYSEHSDSITTGSLFIPLSIAVKI